MNELVREVRDLILSARKAVVHSVDAIQVLTSFEIGRRIVEHEQQGAERAKYGKALIKELAAGLTQEFGRGFSERNLRNMRKFFPTYQDRLSETRQVPSAKCLPAEKSQTVSRKLALPQRSQKMLDELAHAEASPRIWQMASAKFISPFKLSWSQYVFLISIGNNVIQASRAQGWLIAR